MLNTLMKQAGAEEVLTGQKNDPNLNPIGPYNHGPNGLFNVPGSNDAVFSAMLMPTGGVLDVIPAMDASRTSGGMFGAEDVMLDSMLTGVTAGAGDDYDNQPTTDCADGPIGGLKKLCTIVNIGGRYRHGVREVSIYRAGRRQSLCDPLTLRLMNAPAMREFFGVPANTPSMQNAISNEIAERMWESVVSARRAFAREVWNGSPASNSGEFHRIIGLQTHINTSTHVDYKSSAICTAADPDVKNFGFDLVNGTGRDIVQYIEMCDAFTSFTANRSGLNGVEGVIVMRPELFREITAIWPVNRHLDALNRMNVFNAGRVVINAGSATDERDAMRQSYMLPVNGKMIRVVVDDGLPEDDVTTNANLQAGQYASDIYFLPLRVLGGVPVTFFEYYNHNNSQSSAIARFAGTQATFTTDGGMFRFYVNFKNGCLNMTWEFSPRLRVLTPQVAWRITNVAYQPLQHFRSYDTGSSYFADGGVSQQPSPDSVYTPWSTTTPVVPAT